MRIPFLGRRPNRAEDSTLDGAEILVGAQLERYAESLTPDEETLSRMGAVVRASFANSIVARHAGPARARGRGGYAHHRRAFAAVCAVAILTLSSFGLAAAESGPGQPFYRLRLGIESVNLPPAGSQDRLTADLNRADARLDEVTGSVASSNWNAAADAASAYGDVLAGLTLPADPTARAKVVGQLEDQLTRLERLRANAHGNEAAQLDRAIADLFRLLGIPVPTPPVGSGATPGPNPTDEGGPGETAAGQNPGNGGHNHGKSPQPDVTQSPDDPGSTEVASPSDTDGEHASPTPRPTSTPDESWSPMPSASGGH